MKMKWIKIEDEYLCDIYYSLECDGVEIADLWYDYYSSKWFLNPRIFQGCIEKRSYKEYTIEEIEDVQFRAILDLQASFNKIGYECFEYSNAITDYVEIYLQKIMEEEKANENKGTV